MKTQIFATLSSLTLLTAAAAFAQSDAVMKADIPFAFHIGAKILPAGHYEVHPQIIPGVVLIRCLECKVSAMIQVLPVLARKTPGAATLMFNRYDETYFLSSVWIPGYPQGGEVRKSKVELEFARKSSMAAPAEVALVRK